MLKARAASLQLISMLEQQIEAAISINGLYDLDEMIADFQQDPSSAGTPSLAGSNRAWS